MIEPGATITEPRPVLMSMPGYRLRLSGAFLGGWLGAARQMKWGLPGRAAVWCIRATGSSYSAVSSSRQPPAESKGADPTRPSGTPVSDNGHATSRPPWGLRQPLVLTRGDHLHAALGDAIRLNYARGLLTCLRLS